MSTVILLLILSIVVLYFNNTLRVPSIFDGKFYSTALIQPSVKATSIPEKQIALPDLNLWLDSALANKYQYPDFFYNKQALHPF